jgi:hypothetical protein
MEGYGPNADRGSGLGNRRDLTLNGHHTIGSIGAILYSSLTFEALRAALFSSNADDVQELYAFLSALVGVSQTISMGGSNEVDEGGWYF